MINNNCIFYLVLLSCLGFQGRAIGLAINFVNRPKLFCHAYISHFCDKNFNCNCLIPNTCTMHCMALYVAPIYVPCISYINLIQYTSMHSEWAVKQLKAVNSNLLVLWVQACRNEAVLCCSGIVGGLFCCKW